MPHVVVAPRRVNYFLRDVWTSWYPDLPSFPPFRQLTPLVRSWYVERFPVLTYLFWASLSCWSRPSGVGVGSVSIHTTRFYVRSNYMWLIALGVLLSVLYFLVLLASSCTLPSGVTYLRAARLVWDCTLCCKSFLCATTPFFSIRT